MSAVDEFDWSVPADLARAKAALDILKTTALTVESAFALGAVSQLVQKLEADYDAARRKLHALTKTEKRCPRCGGIGCPSLKCVVVRSESGDRQP